MSKGGAGSISRLCRKTREQRSAIRSTSEFSFTLSSVQPRFRRQTSAYSYPSPLFDLHCGQVSENMAIKRLTRMTLDKNTHAHMSKSATML